PSKTSAQRCQLRGSSQSPWTKTTGVRPVVFTLSMESDSCSVTVAMSALPGAVECGGRRTPIPHHDDVTARFGLEGVAKDSFSVSPRSARPNRVSISRRSTTGVYHGGAYGDVIGGPSRPGGSGSAGAGGRPGPAGAGRRRHHARPDAGHLAGRPCRGGPGMGGRP